MIIISATIRGWSKILWLQRNWLDKPDKPAARTHYPSRQGLACQGLEIRHVIVSIGKR